MLALLLFSVCLSSLLVDLAHLISFFCDLIPLERLLILVILSSLSFVPVGLSVLTLLLLPVSALRFDVESVVSFCSLFAAERQGRLVCLGAVVVIAVGLECSCGVVLDALLFLVVDGVCRPLEGGGLLQRFDFFLLLFLPYG